MADWTQVLKPLNDGWVSKINLALEFKRKQFQEPADEIMRFVKGAYGDWLYQAKDANAPATGLDYVPQSEEERKVKPPSFRMTVNKAAELRDLFGPTLYQRNPDRRCKPKKAYMPPPEYFGDPAQDPFAAQAYAALRQFPEKERVKSQVVAELFELYGNYSPNEHDLEGEARMWVDEALLAGMAVMWPEVVLHPSGLRTVGSFFDPIRNLVLDHDAKRPSECFWVSRLCGHPVWQVEDEYGLPRGSLKGNAESVAHLAEMQSVLGENYRRMQGRSNDILFYFKTWSKMGLGSRLEGMRRENDLLAQQFDGVGDFCYLAVAPGLEYPINLPPEVFMQGPEAVRQKVQWPIPFYLDKGAWPFQELSFHRISEQLWPQAHMASALGELKFINWTYSFLMGKIRTASRDVMVILRELAAEYKDAIMHGPDYSVVQVNREAMVAGIDQIVAWIQHPQFNPEIYKVLEMLMEAFDKRTGLTELMYGQTDASFRSAAESQAKQASSNVRPADMAQRVESASSGLARLEMAAERWILEPADVQPVFGAVGAWLWQEEVLSIPPAELFHSFDCGVEAGSTRRPNRATEAENMNNAMTNLFPTLITWTQSMLPMDPLSAVKPTNALIAQWAKANGWDATNFLLQPPPMMMAPPGMAPGQAPGGAPPGAGPPPGVNGQAAPQGAAA